MTDLAMERHIAALEALRKEETTGFASKRVRDVEMFGEQLAAQEPRPPRPCPPAVLHDLIEPESGTVMAEGDAFETDDNGPWLAWQDKRVRLALARQK